MDKEIITVQGRISYKDLGLADAHNHLWITGQDVPAITAPVLEEQELIERELIAYRQAGGGAQLDCQPGGAGRDGNQLSKLSARTDVHIVACTGFHLKEYYPAGYKIWQMDPSQAADYLLSEIGGGLEETRHKTPVYPGFIKIAVRENLEASPLGLLEAACAANQESGLMVEMHTEKGLDLENILAYLEDKELEPGRLVICHIDKRPDSGLHKELARAGYMLEYDTFFRPKYEPEKNLWPLIREMVEAGYSQSIALATDLADSAMWKHLGRGPGLPGFINLIKQRLDVEIKDPGIVGQLIGGNIAERLAI